MLKVGLIVGSTRPNRFAFDRELVARRYTRQVCVKTAAPSFAPAPVGLSQQRRFSGAPWRLGIDRSGTY
jgi:hypothetical protein